MKKLLFFTIVLILSISNSYAAKYQLIYKGRAIIVYSNYEKLCENYIPREIHCYKYPQTLKREDVSNYIDQLKSIEIKNEKDGSTTFKVGEIVFIKIDSKAKSVSKDLIEQIQWAKTGQVDKFIIKE